MTWIYFYPGTHGSQFVDCRDGHSWLDPNADKTECTRCGTTRERA